MIFYECNKNKDKNERDNRIKLNGKIIQMHSREIQRHCH